MVNELAIKEIEKVEKVLDLMEGRTITVDYTMADGSYSPKFYHNEFFGFVEDDGIFVGDINGQDEIKFDTVERLFASYDDLCYNIDIELKNGNKVKFSC